jgi:hypothetical protein
MWKASPEVTSAPGSRPAGLHSTEGPGMGGGTAPVGYASHICGTLWRPSVYLVKHVSTLGGWFTHELLFCTEGRAG